MCVLNDEKIYYESKLARSEMKLAQESLLMKYGYNVSQQEGLSEARRQKILAVLVDNQILSRSDIISYLHFFIEQRAGRDNYKYAVAKWEADRYFIEHYRNGNYKTCSIKGIKVMRRIQE